MKRILLLIIGLIIAMPSASAAYQTTEKVTIKKLDFKTKNVVIQRRNSDQLWLLHFTGRCDEMREGKKVTLSIQGELNSNNDKIKINAYRQCDIDQAEKINAMFTVNYVYNANTNALLEDEDGNEYEIQYDWRCRSITRSFKDTIYAYLFSQKIAVGDLIYLPRNEGQCPINYIRLKKASTVKKPDNRKDIINPGTVRSLKAIPGNSSAYLYWNKSTDNIGIDHYIISSSPYKLNPKDYKVHEMPNQTTTKKTNITIDNLNNERNYYFYILAVDTTGNMSNVWSEVKTMPKSSIAKERTSGKRSIIELRKTHESTRSFLFRWKKVPSYLRQTVILESNKNRDFVYTEWNKYYMRILKKDYRKGNSLKLIIHQYDIHEQQYTDEIEFRF